MICHRRFSCWFSARRVSSWMLISVSEVGHTLSAFPSGKRVQFHANTCTPGEESWIQFSSWLVTSEVPLVLEWYGHTSLWVWSPWRHCFVLSGAYILALQVFHREVHCSSRILRLPSVKGQITIFFTTVFVFRGGGGVIFSTQKTVK